MFFPRDEVAADLIGDLAVVVLGVGGVGAARAERAAVLDLLPWHDRELLVRGPAADAERTGVAAGLLPRVGLGGLVVRHALARLGHASRSRRTLR